MKKFLALLLVMLMAFGLVGCGASEKPAAEEPAVEEITDWSTATLEQIKENLTTVNAGKFTVATSPDFAPYEFYSINEAGEYELAGFDMALAQYIADYLGLELEIIPMDFDGTLTELAAKNVDASLAGYSPDPARMDKMDFSELYYMGGQSFVTVNDKKDLFPDLAATNNPEYSIGAQNGSIQMDLALENSADADVVSLTKVTDIIAELLSDKLDGAYIETAVAESYATVYPDLYIALEVPYDAEGSAVGVSKDNAPLLAGINLAVKAALADGSMDRFVAEASELASGQTYEGLIEITPAE